MRLRETKGFFLQVRKSGKTRSHVPHKVFLGWNDTDHRACSSSR